MSRRREGALMVATSGSGLSLCRFSIWELTSVTVIVRDCAWSTLVSDSRPTASMHSTTTADCASIFSFTNSTHRACRNRRLNSSVLTRHRIVATLSSSSFSASENVRLRPADGSCTVPVSWYSNISMGSLKRSLSYFACGANRCAATLSCSACAVLDFVFAVMGAFSGRGREAGGARSTNRDCTRLIIFPVTSDRTSSALPCACLAAACATSCSIRSRPCSSSDSMIISASSPPWSRM
mmetsp:Transcript_33295/g.59611  ORF Transcript_33295/g.59611 Transcript_33295/m.59611 type:complete len:238 (-) Transcript_33295:581-1294(-)